ncbi:FAD:protein FMN transferase [Gorillibacterium massiliense]|uniref:FAD:protein FMN transferase n=1 Tax=Gorillibacterium massiliense TaxID=1280390 RepID=UPI0004B5F476|nr:FAD:protein FMN transferase [Gorillibacterium massiliense]
MQLRHRKKLPFLLVLVLVLIAVLSGCGKSAGNTETTEPKSERFYIFDTIVTVKIYDTRANDATFNGVNAVLQRIDHEVNREDKTSEISKVNSKAGDGEFVPVSEETFKVIKRAVDYSESSGGVFDLTVGPLVDLWAIGKGGEHVPPKTDIEDRLKLIDYKQVELNEADHSVRLLKPKMSIDLGGIAKGYSADAIAEYLQGQGFKSAIIDLGGNILAMGPKPGNKDWVIGVQNPEESRGAYIGTLKVQNKTVVSSGVYERFFIEDGVRYHHIMNTSTGYPVRNGLTSVTIVTDHSFDADGRSNTTFSMGIEKGTKFVEGLKNTEAIFITEDHKVYITPGLKGIFTLTDNNFTLMN